MEWDIYEGIEEKIRNVYLSCLSEDPITGEKDIDPEKLLANAEIIENLPKTGFIDLTLATISLQMKLQKAKKNKKLVLKLKR